MTDKKNEELKALKPLVGDGIENCERECTIKNDEVNYLLFEA